MKEFLGTGSPGLLLTALAIVLISVFVPFLPLIVVSFLAVRYTLKKMSKKPGRRIFSSLYKEAESKKRIAELEGKNKLVIEEKFHPEKGIKLEDSASRGDFFLRLSNKATELYVAHVQL